METDKNSEIENGEYFSDGIAVYEIEIEEQAGVLIQYVTDKSMDNFVMDEESTSAAVSPSSPSLKEELDAENSQDSSKSDIADIKGISDVDISNSVLSINKNDNIVETATSLYTEDMNVSITPCKLMDITIDEASVTLKQDVKEIGIELLLPLSKSFPTTPERIKLPTNSFTPSPAKLNMVPSILNRAKFLQKSPSVLLKAPLNSPNLEGEGNTTDTSCSSPIAVAKDSVPQRISVLGKEQAKRRLQAFSLTKQSFVKSPLAKKIVKPVRKSQDGSENDYENNSMRAVKRAMLPNEKAKAVIEEIEELKKGETAYLSALKEGILNKATLTTATKERDSRRRRTTIHERSRSRERSYSKERNFGRDTDRNRNKRRSNRSSSSARKKKPQYRNRSKSTDSRDREKLPKKVITYPTSWTEFKINNCTLEDILKVKPEDSTAFTDLRKLVASLVTFEGQSPQKYDLIVKGLQGNDKTCPQEYLNYTTSQPSVSFCENTLFAPNLFFNKARIFAELGPERLDHISKIMNATKSKAKIWSNIKEQRWYLKDNYLKESDTDAECHILENDIGTGLAILKCYDEDEEDDRNIDSFNNTLNVEEQQIESNVYENKFKKRKKDRSSNEKTKRKSKKKKKGKEKRSSKEKSVENTSSIEMRLRNLSTERSSADFKFIGNKSKQRSDKSKSTSLDRSVKGLDLQMCDNSYKKEEKRTKRKQEKEMRTIKKVVEIAKDILEKDDYEKSISALPQSPLLSLRSPINKYRKYEEETKMLEKQKNKNNYSKGEERNKKNDGKKLKNEIISAKEFDSSASGNELRKLRNEVIPMKEIESRICENETRKSKTEVISVREFQSEIMKPERKKTEREVIPLKELETVKFENVSIKKEIIPLKEFELKSASEDLEKEDKDEDDTPKTEEYHSNWEGDDELTLFEAQGSRQKGRKKSLLHHSGWESDEEAQKADRKQQYKAHDEHHRKDLDIGRENRRSIDRDFSLYCNPHREERWEENRKSFDRSSNSVEKKYNRNSDIKCEVDGRIKNVKVHIRERSNSFETRSNRSTDRVRSRERSASFDKRSNRSADIKTEEERRHNVRVHSRERDRKSETRTYQRGNERKIERESSYDRRKDDRFNWEDDEVSVERKRDEKLQNRKSWEKEEKPHSRKKFELVNKFEQYYNEWEDQDQFEIEAKNTAWKSKFQTKLSLSPMLQKEKSYNSSKDRKVTKVDIEANETSLSPQMDHKRRSRNSVDRKLTKHESDKSEISFSPPHDSKHTSRRSDGKVVRQINEDDISRSPPIIRKHNISEEKRFVRLAKDLDVSHKAIQEEDKHQILDANNHEKKKRHSSPARKSEKKTEYEHGNDHGKQHFQVQVIRDIPVPPAPVQTLPSHAIVENKEVGASKLVSEYEEFMKAVSGEVEIDNEAEMSPISLPIKTKAEKKYVQVEEENVDESKTTQKTEQTKKKKTKEVSSSSSSSSEYSTDSETSTDESSISSSSESDASDKEKSEKKHPVKKTNDNNISVSSNLENAPKASTDWVNEFSLEAMDYNITDIELPSSIASNIPLPGTQQDVMKMALKEEETQSPESSTTNVSTPSPRKSRPLIPIKFLTAESRKQAAASPITQTNSGFGVFEQLDVLTPTDSPKVSSTNLYESIAKIEDDGKSEQALSRKRHFPWASASTPTKKLLLDETKEPDEFEEDFTDKFKKKPEEQFEEKETSPPKQIDVIVTDVKTTAETTAVLKEKEEVVPPKSKPEPTVHEKETHVESHGKEQQKDRKTSSSKDKSSDRLRPEERSRRSLSGDRRGSKLGGGLERKRGEKGRRSRDRFNNERSRRSRSRSYDKSGRLSVGNRSLRRVRSRERDRRRRRERTRSRSRSMDRRNDRRIKRNTRSPEKDRRTRSPGLARGHDVSDYNNPYMDIAKSPVNSPLDGFKRSLADSTISDSDLLLQRHNSEDYSETSPRYCSSNAQYYPPHIVHPAVSRAQQQPSGHGQSVGSPSSPKRIPLDDRINQVLGIDKDPPKQIGTVYSQQGPQQHHQYNTYAPNYYEQYAGQFSTGSYDQYGSAKALPHSVPHYPPPYSSPYPPQSAATTPYSHVPSPKVVQVGNVLQVVPTEGIISSVPHRPPVASPSMTKSTTEGAPKVVQVGNMLQIVPQPIPLPAEKTVVTAAVAASSPLISIIPQSIVTPHKESPVISIQHKNSEQLVAERRAEREKRRMEREKRRKEKEKKRKEKDKRKQLKIKLKTENMIKRALLLETEGAMALGEPSEPDLLDPEEESPIIASWPPPPIVLPTSNLKPAGKGILINHDYSSEDVKSKFEEKKSVKFADGICPGEGTSPSGGEDLPSPPPPTSKLPKEKKFKKIKPKIPKINKKKKIKKNSTIRVSKQNRKVFSNKDGKNREKPTHFPSWSSMVKIIRTQPHVEEDSEEDNLPPPSPPPGSPPPHLFPPRIKTHTINNIHPNHPLEMQQQTQMQQFPYHAPGYPPVILYPGHQVPPQHGPALAPPHNHPHAPPHPHMSHGPSPTAQGYVTASHPPVYPIQAPPGLHQTQHPPALPPQGSHLNRNY